MPNKLDSARRALMAAQESVKKRLEDIETERTGLKASLKSLEAALKALDKPHRGDAQGLTAVDELGTAGKSSADSSASARILGPRDVES